MSMNIVVGKKYRLNEDMKNLYDVQYAMWREPIEAGTVCEVIEYDENTHPYLTIEVNGLKVRTEDHMLDEIE